MIMSQPAVSISAVLNFEYARWDLEPCTIRHYLVELAKQCWIKEDCFGGKRPFGNSGWKWDIYCALAEGGFVTGTKDEDDCWDRIDEVAADLIIAACFEKLQEST
jgi:hypothetical protein